MGESCSSRAATVPWRRSRSMSGLPWKSMQPLLLLLPPPLLRCVSRRRTSQAGADRSNFNLSIRTHRVWIQSYNMPPRSRQMPALDVDQLGCAQALLKMTAVESEFYSSSLRLAGEYSPVCWRRLARRLGDSSSVLIIDSSIRVARGIDSCVLSQVFSLQKRWEDTFCMLARIMFLRPCKKVADTLSA